MTWAKGQDIIDELVGLRRLQRVTVQVKASPLVALTLGREL